MRHDRLYLLDIADSITWIQTIAQIGRDSFMQDRLSQDAVIRNFEIIGEATKRLSEELKLAHSHLPWKQVAGLRDILIHNYNRVDLNVVWRIIEHDLPDFKVGIEAILVALE